MSAVIVFGNGLSVGFDPQLSLSSLTDRVIARLGGEYTAILEGLSQLANPDDPDEPVPALRRNFERLAGPIDRLAAVFLALEPLMGADVAVFRSLRTAADELRRHYLKIVGAVLLEIDSSCRVPFQNPAREQQWQRMFALGDSLRTLHARFRSSCYFTLNYDSLLTAAMLERGRYVYDGFRHLHLNEPLDPWREPPLFHLHGSTAWVRMPDGQIMKRSMQQVRDGGSLDRWSRGDATQGLPIVVLGDLKTAQVEHFPIRMFYAELIRRLERVSLAVTGGYSFSDIPLNRALGRFLQRSRGNTLLVWDSTEVDLDRIRRRLSTAGGGGEIQAAQLEEERTELPSQDVVDRLIERLRRA